MFQFKPYPAGDFSWHHLWFIIYLYVYVLLLVPLMLWWRGARRELKPGVWLYALALPLGINEALLKPLFPETHNLIHDWYIFNPLPAAHDLRLPAGVDARCVGLVCAAAALVARAGSHRVARRFALFKTGVIHRDTPADSVFANVFTWMCLLAFLATAAST